MTVQNREDVGVYDDELDENEEFLLQRMYTIAGLETEQSRTEFYNNEKPSELNNPGILITSEGDMDNNQD